MHFLLTNRPERLHLLVAQEVKNANLSQLPPRVAVGGEADVGAVVGQPVLAEELRPAAEGDVVRLEDFLGELRRRDGDCGDAAELEGDDRAVFLRELVEIEVGSGGVELVEEADEGEAGGAGWRWTFLQFSFVEEEED